MSKVERFEDLRVWQETRALAKALYEWTDLLSDYPFRDQVRRAAISIMNNIAEGFERGTDADFARFLDISRGSSGEIRSMLYLGEDLRYLSSADANRLRASVEQLSRGIASLSAYLRPR